MERGLQHGKATRQEEEQGRMTSETTTESSRLTLERILERWRHDSVMTGYSTQRAQGTVFENLCMAFLKHDPVQALQYEEPQSYADWARTQGMSAADTGIDLVTKVRGDDGWCAVQCKFLAENRPVPRKEIDSFLADSARPEFTRRLIIDTTGRSWSRNAENVLRVQSIPVNRIGLSELSESPIRWENFVDDGELVRTPPKELRPHQREAVDAVLTGLADAGTRGKLVMACGTGKTFTSLRIAEDLIGVGQSVLYLVPSLGLMSQTVREWAADATVPMRMFAVCSDVQVGRRRRRDDDLIDMDVLDLAFPATTDAAQLTARVGANAPDEMTIVFATYHSLPVIACSQREHGLADFDLAICDEAHRTAGAIITGEEQSHFVQIHDDDTVRTKRRLYMTGTPKVYAESARNRAGALSATLCSMEDEELYGPVLYEIGFGAAVEQDLLSDYKVLVLTVPEDAAAHVARQTMAQTKLKLDDAAKLVGCWRALAKADTEEFSKDDRTPMRRAIAYCHSIDTSKLVQDLFGQIGNEYSKSTREDDGTVLPEYEVKARHIDGTFNASARNECLTWLQTATKDQDGCRVLTNARCLAEGVDVPALDAILFMHPRKSQIEVVQAVGRVMRKAAGKRMGYVVLPVVIPAGTDPPQTALNSNKPFRVVWQVLNAIRSHDERFDAMINLLEAGQTPQRLGIIALSGWGPPRSSPPRTAGVGEEAQTNLDDQNNGQKNPQGGFEFDLPTAIRAKVVDKCGNRKYWGDWAHDVARIAQTHIERIRAMVDADEASREIFSEFLKELQDDLNEGVTEDDAIEMLAQHMVTGPVFEALHGEMDFVGENPVSRGMQLVLDVLRPASIGSEAESLKDFYASVRRRAETANSAEARQRIVVELYDRFFRGAFPKTTQQLGIVYTPVEVVDFILRSVNDVLEDEFGQSLASDGVHVLDPFTGTGTFITRMIQLGLIDQESLVRKYTADTPEIHANEMVLLAYYIAAVNIEAAFHEATGASAYSHFRGICLTDTFGLHNGEDLIASILPENSEQRQRQKNAPIQVIVGNPPWSVGQRNENDNAKNQSYPSLDRRIAETYAAASQARLVRNLYDSYVRAIRWASDRIGESGVIGFVTSASWLDTAAMAGVRHCLVQEFSTLYVYHLRGDQRTQGEMSRREGGKVFGGGSRAPVAISILVKNPSASERGQILFRRVGDYLNREDKLAAVARYASVRAITAADGWTKLQADGHNDWLNQRDRAFQDFVMIGTKDREHQSDPRLFGNFSLGVVTNRDWWCCNSSCIALEENVASLIAFYNAELDRFSQLSPDVRDVSKEGISAFVDDDPRNISWTRSLKADLGRSKPLAFSDGRIGLCLYRPFTKQHLYFGRRLNEMVYQMPRIFPHETATNRLICVSSTGAKNGFSVFMTECIPNLDLLEKAQCFPLWLYESVDNESLDLPTDDDHMDEHGYVRRDAITAEALALFVDSYGTSVSKLDIFHYVYALLHLPPYRDRFAHNLAKELPRIPLVLRPKHFETLVKEGRALARLHVDYDDVEPWPLEFAKGGWEPAGDVDSGAWFRVDKQMRHPGTGARKDRSTVVYNERITIANVPDEASDYVVNGKTAIAWVMERQCVKTDKASGIVNDANRYAIETMGDPAYPLKLLARVIRVSIETQRIVAALPEPDWR